MLMGYLSFYCKINYKLHRQNVILKGRTSLQPMKGCLCLKKGLVKNTTVYKYDQELNNVS